LDKLIHIASSPEEFLRCIEEAMKEKNSAPQWLDKIDSFLINNSWDSTFAKMVELEAGIQKVAPFENLNRSTEMLKEDLKGAR
jgi:hypothetical protein